MNDGSSKEAMLDAILKMADEKSQTQNLKPQQKTRVLPLIIPRLRDKNEPPELSPIRALLWNAARRMKRGEL